MSLEVRESGQAVELYLYDRIGVETDWWSDETTGISAMEVIDALNDADGRDVVLHIDSAGGDVFEAFAICSAIQRYQGHTRAMVDGLAASAASYIAVVCDEVAMADYAYLMIHCASSWSWGNARELEDVAKRLRNIDDNLAAIYEKRSKLSRDEVLAAMEAETWYTAAAALEAGLCTEVVETEQRMVACIDERTAKHFRHMPEALAAKPAPQQAQAEQSEPAAEESHAVSTIPDDEQAEPVFVVLNSRIYRKENK